MSCVQAERTFDALRGRILSGDLRARNIDGEPHTVIVARRGLGRNARVWLTQPQRPTGHPARRRTGRERRLATQRTEDEARREQARTLARGRRLDKLADDEDVAWSRVEAMIATQS